MESRPIIILLPPLPHTSIHILINEIGVKRGGEIHRKIRQGCRHVRVIRPGSMNGCIVADEWQRLKHMIPKTVWGNVHRQQEPPFLNNMVCQLINRNIVATSRNVDKAGVTLRMAIQARTEFICTSLPKDTKRTPTQDTGSLFIAESTQPTSFRSLS